MIIMSNLVIGYYGHRVGPEINGCIKTGTILTVIGSNGVGKSTFLKTLAGLLPPTSGKLEIVFNNKPKVISYLPQIKNIDCYFPITVFDVVAMGCWPRVRFFKKINSQQRHLILQALEEVQLLDVINQRIDSLSGGQLQCMLFARVLVQQASYVLLDEPFQGLDKMHCKILIRAINKLCKNGCTIVIVLHNRFISEYFIHRDILLLTQHFSAWNTNKNI
ncbi:manganese transport system ATP-binding protein [Candidatus Blochmanniella floridana]|uniref:Manganese transport system ATP-binding protein n=1 Tax=Blochmanniella floridana TaxID=203907 RepID=Q7VQS6_BLOFL|nr:manganese transport system ATP-binding protein [Candidatus Blochmannia floridanus]